MKRKYAFIIILVTITCLISVTKVTNASSNLKNYMDEGTIATSNGKSVEVSTMELIYNGH